MHHIGLEKIRTNTMKKYDLFREKKEERNMEKATPSVAGEALTRR